MIPGILIQILWILAIGLLSWPLGRYLAWVFTPQVSIQPGHTTAARLLEWAGLGQAAEQGWKAYGISILRTNMLMFSVACALLWAQPWLPLNPDGKPALSPDLIFNTAASFTTNTNLQHYSGEVAMSHGSQLWGLMWLQFTSASTGLAALVAVARALAGRATVGNFARDFLRGIVLVLLPGAFLLSLALAAGGVPMTLSGAVEVTTLEGAASRLPIGPAAAFIAIKQLGTNGGGFYGPNSAHPFENPTFWTNLLSLGAILVLPMACVWMFGRLTGRMGHARLLFAVMSLLLLSKLLLASHFESQPAAALAGIDAINAADLNLEGKELRFGPGTDAGTTWAIGTTATSNGSVNCMHDSLQPLTGLLALSGMWINSGFGGIGVGVLNLLVQVLAAVFLGSMLIGRSPEYLQKRLGAPEMKSLTLVLVLHGALILVPTALFVTTSLGMGSLNNPGPHGFSEILYEFTSSAANNGSGFEGLADNTLAWNLSTGLVMLIGRFVPMLWPLAIAGLLSSRRSTADSAGTLDTGSFTFGALLLGVIVLVSALVFFPAALLGPVAEHLLAFP